jgi:hypothetical protein
MVFGGRGAEGRLLRDTWVYHYDADRWQRVSTNEELGLPLPKARYFSAAASLPIPPLRLSRVTSSITCRMKETDRDVYMFGGTARYCGMLVGTVLSLSAAYTYLQVLD